MSHFRRRLSPWALVITAWLLSFALTGVSADAALPRVKEVHLGFGDRYKVGHWTVVAVTMAAGEKPIRGYLELTVPDGDGVPTKVATRPGQAIEVPANEERSFLTYAKLGRIHSSLTVDFVGETGSPVSRSFPAGEIPPALFASQGLMVTVGQPIGTAQAARSRQGAGPSAGMVQSVVDRVDRLPDRWYGYEGVDTLIFTTSRPEIYDDLRDRQVEAIDRWVRLGGRLILCTGSEGETLLAAGGRLERLAPGRFDRVDRHRELAPLQEFAGSYDDRLAQDGDDQPRLHADVTVLTDVHGRVEVRGDSQRCAGPLIVRRPHAFGQLIFVAVDLDKPPLSDWPARGQLVAKLLNTGSDEAEQRKRRGRVTHLGYSDLVGQLRGALDQFAQVRLVQFWPVFAIILVYILLIGPGDYFFLRRFARHMQWTWLTFPLIVVSFCLLAFFLAERYKGSRLWINQVDLVDVDLESSLARGTSWAHIYSPRTESYNLSARVELPDMGAAGQTGMLLSWQGLPGKAIGGMNSTTTTALNAPPYRIAALVPSGGQTSPERTGISEMPIPVWSSKSVASRWWSRADVPPAGRLTTHSQGLLGGRFNNPLAFELRGCILFHDRWAYKIGRIGAGEQVVLDRTVYSVQTAEWLLRKRHVEDLKDLSTPWDQSSFDVPRIMQIMMFYEASGGRRYTNLRHRYQGFVDLSGHLKLGRAILVGRADRRATHLLRDDRVLEDDYDKHWTFFRLVFPTEPAGPKVTDP